MTLLRYVLSLCVLLSFALAGSVNPGFAAKTLRIYPPISKPVTVQKPVIVKAPIIGNGPGTFHKPLPVLKPAPVHKPVVSFISVNECTRMGGRVVHNPSCYSGQQCRGGILNNCIDKAK